MNKKLHYLLLLLIFILASIMLVACASTTSAKKTFAISTYESNIKTQQLVTELTKNLKLTGARVISVSAQGNSTTQIQQIQNFTSASSNKIDGIFVQLIDTSIFDEVVYITQTRDLKKIPTVFLEGTALKKEQDDETSQETSSSLSKQLFAQIQSNNNQRGRLQANFIIKQLSNKGSVALLTKSLTDLNETKYVQEIDKAFQNSNIKITHQQPAYSRRIEAIKIAENWINTNENFDAIITSDDKMALGASLVLQENNMNNVIITSAGSSNEAINAIKDGSLDMTLISNIKDTARIGVKTMLQIVQGKEFQKVINIMPIVVTKENISKYF